jgi:hypothetical protein
LHSLGRSDYLYVGAQTQDRMFRGDGTKGRNFHHAQMRAGNGADTPEAFLRTGRQITIYRADSARIESLVETTPALNRLRVLAQQPRTKTKHLGWWYEQYALATQFWCWNTAGPDQVIKRLLA